MDIYEIGIYEAIGTGVTTSVGTSFDVSQGMEFLQGTSNKWGGFGFGISIGGGPNVFVAEAGGSFGLVFSAMESGGRQYVDELIGFNVYLNVGAGPENPIPVSVSVSCALAKVSTPQKCKKPEPPKCPNQNLKEMINKLKKTGEQMGQNWVDLYETCKDYWGKKWKKCENAADNYADAVKGCSKGFTRKCVSFKSDYCQEGKWKEGTKTCEKYYKEKGECKTWNIKQKCSNYGQKQGSCKEFNTRRYCSRYGQKNHSCRNWNYRRSCSNYGSKRGSCRSWNRRRYCGKHGSKRKCDRVRKATRWARIPYICGINFCKRGWFRYPCGKRICHKNIAKAIMGWSCKIVTDASRCLRHVVKNISCRSWNKIRDYSRCVAHVIRRTSCRTYNKIRDYSRCLGHAIKQIGCRSWNMIEDTANCVKHVAEQTTCQTWNMIEDTAKCLSGWVYTAGKCLVDTVGHCRKWAETCTENHRQMSEDMFKHCGLNILPYVPVPDPGQGLKVAKSL